MLQRRGGKAAEFLAAVTRGRSPRRRRSRTADFALALLVAAAGAFSASLGVTSADAAGPGARSDASALDASGLYWRAFDASPFDGSALDESPWAEALQARPEAGSESSDERTGTGTRSRRAPRGERPAWSGADRLRPSSAPESRGGRFGPRLLGLPAAPANAPPGS
jgi:hypothetical protein